MVKRLSRIVPWQAGKVSAVIYFVLGGIFAIPFGMLSALLNPGTEGKQLSVGFFIILPFLYAALGLLFVPLVCWLYNLAARLVEFSLEDRAET